MSLGLAKDSIGDLLKFAAEAEEGGEADGGGRGDASVGRRIGSGFGNRSSPTHGDVGDVSNVPLRGVRKESISLCDGDAVAEVGRPCREGDRERGQEGGGDAAAVSSSNPPSIGSDPYDYDYFFDEECYDRVSFLTPKRKPKKLLCCLLPPWLAGNKGEMDTDDEDEGDDDCDGDDEAAVVAAAAAMAAKDGEGCEQVMERGGYGGGGGGSNGGVIGDLNYPPGMGPAHLYSGLMNSPKPSMGKGFGPSVPPMSPLRASPQSHPYVGRGKAAAPPLPPPLVCRSILRRGSRNVRRIGGGGPQDGGAGGTAGKAAGGDENPRRRSFLPNNYKELRRSPSTGGVFGTKRVRFIPIARRVNVKSHRDMDPAEKLGTWWQLDDFEEFKRANSTITKAALHKGLASSVVFGGPICQGSDVAAEGAGIVGGSVSGSGPTSTDAVPYDLDDADGKWWHKYGHSRRGLEQFVSNEEARQRQFNVRLSHRAIIEEQNRQRLLGMNPNPEKIARIAREYTAWAKDLALAAGASDADAVQSGFKETRKSREFFLLKHTLGSQCAVAPHTPAFMVPPGLPTRILDANTSSSILYRKKLQRQMAERQKLEREQNRDATLNEVEAKGQVEEREASLMANEMIGMVQRAAAASSADASAGTKGLGGGGDGGGVGMNDSPSDVMRPPLDDMAKKAAGFGGGGKKMDMSVVMSTYDPSNLDE